jgi:23S rRNA pseudouridine2605 synthase
VVDVVDAAVRVYPVGRLDADSEGLILLTNDGELAQRLTHPSFGVEKEYLVSVEGSPGRQSLRRLREGVELEDGLTAPARVAQPSPGLLRITIHEGRNRQIRRMCAAIGHPVSRLVRTRIGPIADPNLPPGHFREITREERRRLEEAIGDPTDRGRRPGQ